tara:strand:+ start:3237 stop:3437 length:201 start_codon:yes stop_codon:yes gene_type:complete
MTHNEIKKALYREKPTANLKYIRSGVAYYYAFVSDEAVDFEVPVSDMGDAEFYDEMEAHLMIRWLV